MSLIFKGLHLGDVFDASSPRLLAEKQIVHVLTVADMEIAPPIADPSKHKQLRLKDSATENIGVHLLECCRWLDERLGQGNILVHCQAGISRSATVVIAYVIWITKGRMDLSLDDAIAFVRSFRPIVNPNPNFCKQLAEWHACLQSRSQD